MDKLMNDRVRDLPPEYLELKVSELVAMFSAAPAAEDTAEPATKKRKKASDE